MLRLAADENFNADIVRGLLRRLPDLDIARAQDAGLSGADDPAVLEWAAREGWIVLTHDISALVSFAFERVAAGRPMPVSSQRARAGQSARRSRTSCFLPNVVLRVSGKGRLPL